MAAVVVTAQLDWRLHGLDLLSEHHPPTQGTWPLTNAAWMVGVQYKPAEVGKVDWQAVQQGPPWAVDAWGLGCLMQEVFSGPSAGAHGGPAQHGAHPQGHPAGAPPLDLQYDSSMSDTSRASRHRKQLTGTSQYGRAHPPTYAVHRPRGDVLGDGLHALAAFGIVQRSD